jgi:hypothetical protein
MALTRSLGISLVLALAVVQMNAFARGGGGGHRGASVSPGTGSSSSSHSVRGYTRKDGTYVAPHRQSNPDKNFRNNWSTKGNVNPNTGKEGTRTEPPKKQ